MTQPKTLPTPEPEPKRRGRKPTPAEKPDFVFPKGPLRDWLAWMIAEAGITQEGAAEMIARQTGRPCSTRSIRAWLAKPEAPSASPCPEWAVTALRKKLVALKRIQLD